MYTDTLTLYFIDIYQLYTTYIQYTEYKRWIINFNDSSFKDEICIHVQDTYMYIYSYMYYDMEYNCTDLLHTCTCTCILKTMKRNFKQWWTTIPPISTKRTITSHLKSVNIKKTMKYAGLSIKGGTMYFYSLKWSLVPPDIIKQCCIRYSCKLFKF